MASVLWTPCRDGAKILRVLGDTPCPAVPAAVDGLPVTELGAYCFSAKAVSGGQLYPPGSPDTHEIVGEFVQQVTLPDRLHTLHSAAFYNCRSLRTVQMGAAAENFGSDLFTNCRSLQTLVLHAAPAAPTGLRKLLVGVSADLCVQFAPAGKPEAELFYPEYFEYMDENAPAHIFNHQLEGEGYRMRQCFAAGAVDFAAYDAVFAQACVGESVQTLCRLALARLCLPFALSDAARTDYEFYLTAHPDAAFALAIRRRDEAALRVLVALGLPTAAAAALCGRAGWSAGAAILLQRPKKAPKSYDFDDL